MNYLPSALKNFAEIETRISKKPLLLGLDFDGVLAPIVRIVPNAAAGRPIQKILRSLTRRKGIRVAIVTGRRLAQIKNKVPIKGLAYSGNHGLEIEDARFQYLHPKARRAQKFIPDLANALESAIAPFQHAEVERKDISLSVHFRRCTQRTANAGLRAALGLVKRSRKPIRSHVGYRVLEVQPDVAWDKGNAFNLLHKRIGGTPVFLGDEFGDEAAFKTADRRGGFGIRVSPSGKTNARYQIPSQRGVLRFLERIDALYR